MAEKNQIIQDYGLTTTVKRYLNGIQSHPYIPQADQCFLNIVEKKYEQPGDWFSLLDIGCGPDRLTSKLFRVAPLAEAIGVDISESFIDYAVENRMGKVNPTFLQLDFAQAKELKVLHPKAPFDVMVMQGVMHHIHGSDRDLFFDNARNLLVSDGILIIGDEFIRDYETQELRRQYVMMFYLHIIDEARKGGSPELAEEEAKNLIDDYFSGTKYAGYGNDDVYQFIYEYAKKVNNLFYSRGGESINNNLEWFVPEIEKVIKEKIEHLTENNSNNFNRGDHKVSIDKFVAEVTGCGFKLEETYKFGPVDQLGGMGVLVFRKG
jgi:SAM-dependent methyltransferase